MDNYSLSDLRAAVDGGNDNWAAARGGLSSCSFSSLWAEAGG